jgi:ligand-binding sensor domain-containing protein
VDKPSIRVFSGQNYNQVLRSLDQVKNGVLNSKGQNKKIILAYAVEGYPLVPNESSIGYVNNNAYGPLRLLIEENKSMWIKWTDCIVVGTGNYEEPLMADVVELDLPELEGGPELLQGDNIWLTYRNDTGLELQEASVRAMEYDNEGNLWVSTNNGGTSFRTPDGKWTLVKSVETTNRGEVELDTSYAIVQRENGELWMTLGRETNPKGILVKTGDSWRVIDKENSELPACFVQELELDNKGGLWLGTKNGLVHVDKDDKWEVFIQEQGLLPLSVDTIELDKDGGVWVGYYPEAIGSEDNVVYKGCYQYISKDGEVTTYDGFDQNNFNVNWVRSISIDAKGGVWIVRSGNAPGLGKGEIDYIFEGERKVYTAKDIYKDIAEDNDIRMLRADPKDADILYMATTLGGLIQINTAKEKYVQFNSENVFPTKQWNNVYYLDFDGEDIFIGTNGGAGIYTAATTFADVKNHWANAEIAEMATMGYIKGSKGSFRPNEKITRAEFVSLIALVKSLDLNEKGETDFADISNSMWFAKSVGTVSKAGFVKGYPDNTFRPNAYISRQEISNVLGSLIDTEMGPSKIESVLSVYKDAVPEWAKLGVARTTDKGIIKGLSEGVFGGAQNATRAQVAVMLLRFLR